MGFDALCHNMEAFEAITWGSTLGGMPIAAIGANIIRMVPPLILNEADYDN